MKPTATGPVRAAVSVGIIPESLVLLPGKTAEATASVRYGDGTQDSALEWSCADTTICSVRSGKVSAVAEGVTTLVAHSVLDPAVKASITVTVKPSGVVPAVISVEPTAVRLKKGETVQLKGMLKLSDASTSSNIGWTSADSTVAVVHEGLVTGAKAGKTTITAYAQADPTRRASVDVVVGE